MLGLGLLVIACRNPVNSAMFLVTLFFCMAGLFVLLGAYFLAAIQILVYAGAIMVLFLFVVMLLDPQDGGRRRLGWFGLLNGALVALLLAGGFALLRWGIRGDAAPAGGGIVGTTEAIGRLLFTGYLLPFEVASVLLLAAIVGAIRFGRREAREGGRP